MKIAVIGAGAVGGYFGGRLVLAGQSVCFLARGATKEALRTEGLRVQSVDGDFAVRPLVAGNVDEVTQRLGGRPDLLLITVKSPDTADVADLIQPLLTESSIALTLQNGIENEEVLAERLGWNHVLSGVTYIAADRVKPNEVVHSGNGWLRIGEWDGGVSERVEAIAALFRLADVRCEISSDIRRAKWIKLMWNAVFNPLNAMTERALGPILQDEGLQETCRRALAEVAAVARAEGVDVDDAQVERTLQQGRDFVGRTSMLQDRKAGRLLEVDGLTGAVLRRAHRHGVDAPVIAAFDSLCRALMVDADAE